MAGRLAQPAPKRSVIPVSSLPPGSSLASAGAEHAIFSPLVFARPLASTSLGNSPLTATFTFFQRSVRILSYLVLPTVLRRSRQGIARRNRLIADKSRAIFDDPSNRPESTPESPFRFVHEDSQSERNPPTRRKPNKYFCLKLFGWYFVP